MKFDVKTREGALVISFSEPWRCLSSSIVGGGFSTSKWIINLSVGKDYHSETPEKDLREAALKVGIEDEFVGMMTAAKLENVAIAEEGDVTAVVTAGVSNACAAGDSVEGEKASTINIALLIDAELTEAAMVNAVKTATEAKTIALHDLDVRSKNSDRFASGTSTDTIVVACSQKGKSFRYSGTGTKLGMKISKVVKKAVREGILKQDEIDIQRSMAERLEERSITVDAMVKAAMELFVPHPGIEDRKKAEALFRKELEAALQDINICSLVVAGLRLEEDAWTGSIPGLKRDVVESDAVHILADEVIGMAIAEYIGGTKARFEYVRFDTAKPGILAELGPFADDTICGLIAGASSRMYSEAGEKG